MNAKHKAYLILTTFFLTFALSASAWAAAPETMRVWRAQIQFQTANVTDAGTDDSVQVQLNGTNSTWLDYGRDDFERNTNYTYDLKLNGISRLSDLHYIFISKTGDDGWAIKSFSLLINGRAIYTQTFPGSAGKWLDNDGGNLRTHFVPSFDLRHDDAWLSYVAPFPPLTIPRAEMESRVEGIIGDYIHSNRLEWGHLFGSRYVEATRKNNNTLHFDLDLEADLPVLPNPEVDVDFDVEITCSSGTISMKVKNVVADVNSNPVVKVLTLGLIEFLDSELSDRINDAAKNIKIGQDVPLGFCPGISVDSLVNIRFTPPIIIGAQGQPLAQRAAVREDRSEEVATSPDDNTKALAVNVEVGEARANEELPYSISVKSNRAEAGQFEASLELPAGAQLASAVIEVVDDAGNRSVIGAQATPEEGKTVLHFRDFLTAGAAKTYTAKVSFVVTGDAQITTRVVPLTETETADEAAAVKAVTFLQTSNEVTRAKATLKQSAAKAEAKPE